MEIKFSFLEKIAVMRGSFKIPTENVSRAHSDRPKTEVGELRLMGTSIPGAVKTGTYRTRRGKELWYVSHGDEKHHSN